MRLGGDAKPPEPIWLERFTVVVLPDVVVPNGEINEYDLRVHVRGKLAGYKTPKRILVSGVSLRAPNGKADYKSALDFAKRELGIA